MRCITHADPLPFWEQLLGALASGSSAALLSPAWPANWRDQLTGSAGSVPASSEPSILIPTSGTSSLPKFCIHDLDTLTCAAIGFSHRFGSQGIIHSVSLLPPHHVGGLMPVFRAAECGGRVHFGDYQRPGSLASAPFPLGQACLSVVPTQLGRMMKDEKMMALLRRFALILMGGAASPASLLHTAREAQLNLSPCYGSTETAAMVTAMDPHAFLSGTRGVGTPLPHARIEVDASNRILVTAGSNSRGYWPPQDDFKRNPLQTGDLGSAAEDGNLEILGRADRVIITGGEKVYPEQVESAVLSTELVRQAYCEGLQDPDWGQRVELTVVASGTNPGQAAVIEALRDRLPSYALPKKVHFVDQLDTNSMGKPVK
jgi:O-succinylbenzoic acid--CoA ligase